MSQQFFVGPIKITKKAKTESVAAPPPKLPTKRRPRSDPVKEAQETFTSGVENHREHFRLFLRSSLALLDGDIVETVVKEFDNHCACENRAVEAASHFLATATRNRLLPELRHFQLIVDAAETSCTDECVQVIATQRQVTMQQTRADDLIAIEMPPEKGGVHPGTQVDLMLLGGVNDLLAWGEHLRDTMIIAYRAAEAGPQQPNGRRSKEKERGLRAGMPATHRPSTAPSRRRKPPVGGGFLGISTLSGSTQDTQQRNVYTTGVIRPASAQKRKQNLPPNQTVGHLRMRRDEDRPQERRLLRQTLGSYYSHDGASPSNLSSLLTSNGGFGGSRHPMPAVQRTHQKNNPNRKTRQRARMRAKNKVDLAHYNAFRARPMLRGASTMTFDGPRRRQVPRSSSTSTIEMQKRHLLRGLPQESVDEHLKHTALIDSQYGDSVNMPKQRNGRPSSSINPSKSLQIIKNRHQTRTKKVKNSKDLSGWD